MAAFAPSRNPMLQDCPRHQAETPVLLQVLQEQPAVRYPHPFQKAYSLGWPVSRLGIQSELEHDVSWCLGDLQVCPEQGTVVLLN